MAEGEFILCLSYMVGKLLLGPKLIILENLKLLGFEIEIKYKFKFIKNTVPKQNYKELSDLKGSYLAI